MSLRTTAMFPTFIPLKAAPKRVISSASATGIRLQDMAPITSTTPGHPYLPAKAHFDEIREESIKRIKNLDRRGLDGNIPALKKAIPTSPKDHEYLFGSESEDVPSMPELISQWKRSELAKKSATRATPFNSRATTTSDSLASKQDAATARRATATEDLKTSSTIQRRKQTAEKLAKESDDTKAARRKSANRELTAGELAMQITRADAAKLGGLEVKKADVNELHAQLMESPLSKHFQKELQQLSRAKEFLDEDVKAHNNGGHNSEALSKSLDHHATEMKNLIRQMVLPEKTKVLLDRIAPKQQSWAEWLGSFTYGHNQK